MSNKEFSKTITTLLEKFNQKIDYITLFLGPSPLTTTASICAWVKGWSMGAQLPVVTISGALYYIYDESESCIITKYNGTYVLVNNNCENAGSVEEINHFLKKKTSTSVSLVCGVQDSLFCFSSCNAYYRLFPSIDKIAQSAFEKYMKNETTALNDIKPTLSYAYL